MGKKEERPAVRTTIVGGRPPGSGKEIGDVPHGIDALIERAAKDLSFRTNFLAADSGDRANVAKRAGIKLEPSEAAMLEVVTVSHLAGIISLKKAQLMAEKTIKREKRLDPNVEEVGTRGIRPDRPKTKGIQPDKPARFTGIQPDRP